ncbi:CPXCG motif-containing cysteine-rich protein [Alcanivorax sp. JB21]|uniref:CPXCG motif-containing cysteine-rich protein n=1 Tax=Alcanivorax limicola TaxID=2874102 RepID=UPI001CBB4472|nr:CPXCG motif-containing cysteine-rich protein [Alcanivorax limicola]MBZ2190506.1 CPXCG motif-containing cysteine-rich protein [Alcanivorax limicola]
MQQESAYITCPYCWETIEILVDPSEPAQQYVEDCSVCCHPIELSVSVAPGGDIAVEAHSDDD